MKSNSEAHRILPGHDNILYIMLEYSWWNIQKLLYVAIKFYFNFLNNPLYNNISENSGTCLILLKGIQSRLASHIQPLYFLL